MLSSSRTSSKFVIAADAIVGAVGYFRSYAAAQPEAQGALAQRYWFDALILIGLGVSIAVAVTDLDEPDAPNGPLWFDVAVTFAFFVPLLFRRRFPFVAPVVAAVAVTASTFLDEQRVPCDFMVFLLGMTIAFMFGALRGAPAGDCRVRDSPRGQRDRHSQRAGPGAWSDFDLEHASSSASRGRSASASATSCGRPTRRRSALTRLERARERGGAAAVAEERARIARELHDVVGHSVSVMTVQAAGVRRLLKPEQEREREALEIVEQTGREALAEMRRLVGVLRRPEEAPALAPQPSLEHLDRLVAQAREAGLPVELKVEGDPVQLAAGLDLTAYRLVQEGSDERAEARAGRATPRCSFATTTAMSSLTVTDDGKGDGGGESGGHGLVGMRERVSVYGGELEAGPRPEGRLPVACETAADLTGTYTFLLTDIEGSTSLVRQLRDQYGDVLAEHHRVLRGIFEEAGGEGIGTQGDAFFVAFRRPKDAVARGAGGTAGARRPRVAARRAAARPHGHPHG